MRDVAFYERVAATAIRNSNPRRYAEGAARRIAEYVVTMINRNPGRATRKRRIDWINDAMCEECLDPVLTTDVRNG